MVVPITLEAELAGTPYRPVRLLGRGSTALVLEVVHRHLEIPLALKILADPGRADLRERLRREAWFLARLAHPNLISVRDFGETPSGRAFLVSELCSGRPLADWVTSGAPMEERAALEIVIDVLRGLETAHRFGLVHRDLTLRNIVVDEGPPRQVKVIDFGALKRLEGAEEPLFVGEPTSVATEEGVLVGTPLTMSPEQLVGEAVDVRSDIYSVGVVLYRLLSGQNPFSGPTLVDLFEQHLEQEPPPLGSLCQVSAETVTMVHRALSKGPRQRFQTASEMRLALEYCLHREGPWREGAQRSTSADEPRRDEVRTLAEAGSTEEVTLAVGAPAPVVERTTLRMLGRAPAVHPTLRMSWGPLCSSAPHFPPDRASLRTRRPALWRAPLALVCAVFAVWVAYRFA